MDSYFLQVLHIHNIQAIKDREKILQVMVGGSGGGGIR